MAQKGAACLVVSKEVEVPADSDVTVVKVADTRLAMAFISAAYFGHPAEKMKIIGITGTKGKTTTTYMVRSILENAGFTVEYIKRLENNMKLTATEDVPVAEAIMKQREKRND